MAAKLLCFPYDLLNILFVFYWVFGTFVNPKWTFDSICRFSVFDQFFSQGMPHNVRFFFSFHLSPLVIVCIGKLLISIYG